MTLFTKMDSIRKNRRASVGAALAVVLGIGPLSGCGDEALPDEPAAEVLALALTRNHEIAYRFFVDKGLTNFQSAGIVGNLHAESSLDPTIRQIGGGPGRGIAQWEVGGRWDRSANDNVVWFARQRGASEWSLELQLEFVWYELTTFPYLGLGKLRATTNVTDATIVFQREFERCSQCRPEERIRSAQEILNAYGAQAPQIAVTDPRVFHWAFYPTVYPDVAAAFEGNFWGMVAHWRDFGVPEGRIGGPGFVSTFYLDSYADLRQALGRDYRAAIGHFLSFGLNEGRTASPVFDPPYYLGLYEDLRAAFGPTGYAAAMTHWVDHGMAENRLSSPAFDQDYYLDAYVDLRNAFGTNTNAARNHFLMNGMHEGRSGSPVFDPAYYLGRYDDLSAAFGPRGHVNALIHWMRTGIGECRQASPAFDPQFYLERHPDLRAAFGNNCVAARNHYLATLQREGRVASRVFEPGYYLNRYPDLRNAFGNDAKRALHHWVGYGIAEGRQGSALFDPAYYLANNPDVAAAVGPRNYAAAILHWDKYGMREGRRGAP
jgi:hypothetical protein